MRDVIHSSLSQWISWLESLIRLLGKESYLQSIMRNRNSGDYCNVGLVPMRDIISTRLFISF